MTQVAKKIWSPAETETFENVFNRLNATLEPGDRRQSNTVFHSELKKAGIDISPAQMKSKMGYQRLSWRRVISDELAVFIKKVHSSNPQMDTRVMLEKVLETYPKLKLTYQQLRNARYQLGVSRRWGNGAPRKNGKHRRGSSAAQKPVTKSVTSVGKGKHYFLPAGAASLTDLRELTVKELREEVLTQMLDLI